MVNECSIPLNEFGCSVWKHKVYKHLFACRSYDWVDRIITIDESAGRKVIGDEPFTTFDFTGWTPVTLEEYASVKFKYEEIYGKDSKC